MYLVLCNIDVYLIGVVSNKSGSAFKNVDTWNQKGLFILAVMLSIDVVIRWRFAYY